MSKGKDFRPRKRGFDDDDEPMPTYTTRPGRSPSRSSFDDNFPPPDMGDQLPMGGAPPIASGNSVSATVKWFKADKGFGFVELGDGSGDAFLHINVLQASGYESVLPGTTLKVIAGPGQKGLQVSSVLDVDASTAETAPTRSFDSPRPTAGARPAPDLSNAIELRGTVKWFDAVKGFGFIAVEDGGKDIFIHVSTLRTAGLESLDENQQVILKITETPKGREAVGISAV